MNRTFHQVSITGVLLSALFIPTLGWGERIHEDIKNTVGKPLSPQEEQILASSATKVLRAIAQARGAVHEQNFTQAKNDLKKVQTLIALINTARPTTRIRDYIWVAQKHLDYESTEKVALDLVPIDMALTELAYVIPIEEAKTHLEAAHKSLTKQDKPAAKKHLEAVKEALVYTDVDLPLSATVQHILNAEQFLQDHKLKETDAALAAAEDGVEFISISMNSYMAHAKKSLWEAMQAYTSGQYVSAKAHLKRAATWLTRVAQGEQPKVDSEAQHLAAEVTALTKNVEQSRENVKTSLNALWEKITSLSTLEAEKVAAGAHRQQNYEDNMALKVNLIEAKFHVSYAETYALTTHNHEMALTELEKAQKHLSTAAEGADSQYKGKIEAAKGKATLIQQSIVSNGQPLARGFADLKIDLRRLLYTMPYEWPG